ncbi:tripartite tricarboxylate transporter substrate binding protein [Roseomonas sp. BN140053]|uniref:tripartite tricarboxylate transporter substrate binding protein n=1 Tax=Roseomonas sp. BN140053 TaxID=3391898 RepID=UPI0039E79638
MREAMLPRRRVLGAAAALAAVPGVARAQPAGGAAIDGVVTLVVPYTPGTGHDILARLMSPFLSQRLGQPVVVDNRAGASGNIGAQQVSRAAPDGRTLMIQGKTFTINPSLFKQVGYDPVHSFAPVIQLAKADYVLAVHPDVPARDVAGFIAYARGVPGGIDYGSPGIGTTQHLGMALFALAVGAEMNHVPYRGAAPAVQDLIGKRLAAMYLPVPTALPLARDGQLRMLAVGSPQRSAFAPDVPTLAEAGWAAAEIDTWYGVLAPAGTPGPVVERLNAEMNGWLRRPETLDALRPQGMEALGGPAAAFGEVIARETARWAEVIRRTGITAG